MTGANKGIGYGIVRKLALEEITVVLTARDEGRGLKATDNLHGANLKVLYSISSTLQIPIL